MTVSPYRKLRVSTLARDGGVDPNQLARALRVKPGSTVYYVAAVREAVEKLQYETEHPRPGHCAECSW